MDTAALCSRRAPRRPGWCGDRSAPGTPRGCVSAGGRASASQGEQGPGDQSDSRKPDGAFAVENAAGSLFMGDRFSVEHQEAGILEAAFDRCAWGGGGLDFSGFYE